MTQTSDAWDTGSTYESYMGRWSRPVARQFLSWLSLPSGWRWLDVGCGTGALSAEILLLALPAEVLGIDPSPDFIAHARQSISDARVRFQTGDGLALPVESDQFDATVSGLALNFMPRPAAAVAEMIRATRTQGVVAAYVWDYAGDMQFLRYFWNAVVALEPAAAAFDEGARFPLCRPERLSDLFQQAGLEDVTVRAIDVPTVFASFSDYWVPFLSGTGPAPGYVTSLDAGRRSALESRLRDTLPAGQDGSITLVARAWAIRGTRNG